MKTQKKNNPQRKTGGGGKLSRSETVTVRLEPKINSLAEVAARKQRRTISSFIEWAVEQALTQVELEDTSSGKVKESTVAEQSSRLWDVDESERFLRMGISFPQLLTQKEQVVWKMIQESGLLMPAQTPSGWDYLKLAKDVYPVIRKKLAMIPWVWEDDAAAEDIQGWIDKMHSAVTKGKIYPQSVLETVEHPSY